MNHPESEKFFLECFDRVINVSGLVMADPKEIKLYGELTQVEGEIVILEKLHNSNPTPEIQEMLLKKKKRFEEICNYMGK